MVNQKVLELDEKLKEMSEKVAENLKKISPLGIKEAQEQFINSLSKTDKVKKKIKKSEDSCKMTGLYASQKLPIKKIAELQELKEETVISHLEKLVSLNDEINLNYLKPEKERFDKIKLAFAQMGDTKLSPVKNILGDSFSYREIRLARLFIF